MRYNLTVKKTPNGYLVQAKGGVADEDPLVVSQVAKTRDAIGPTADAVQAMLKEAMAGQLDKRTKKLREEAE